LIGKKIWGKCVGAAFTAIHVTLACTILYAIICCDDRKDAFMLFGCMSMILLSFTHFQTCVLTMMERLYGRVGNSYADYYSRVMSFIKKRMIVDGDTLERSETMQVIVAAMSLITIKICMLILRDYFFPKI